MTLAYALTVWSAMAGLVWSSGEQRKNRGSPSVLRARGYRCSEESRPCSSGSFAMQCHLLRLDPRRCFESQRAPGPLPGSGSALLSRTLPRPSTLSVKWLATKWRWAMGRALGQPRTELYSRASCSHDGRRSSGGDVFGGIQWLACGGVGAAQGRDRAMPGRDPLARPATAIGSWSRGG